MQCNRGDDLASPAKASALRSHEAKSGMYQVMTYCMIQTPAKSSQHGGVEFFLLKGGINEAGWRRNGTMEGLQWAANKGGVTCECEDAITWGGSGFHPVAEDKIQLSMAKSNTRRLLPSSELRSEAQEYKMTAAMSHGTNSWPNEVIAISGPPPLISSRVKQSECEGVMRSLPLNIIRIELLSCTFL